MNAATKLDVNLINPLNPELNPICYLLALLGAHHFLHVSRIRVKYLTLGSSRTNKVVSRIIQLNEHITLLYSILIIFSILQEMRKQWLSSVS